MVNPKSIFESGIGKLARILARQFLIKVVFKGSGAYTDGKTIFLPSTGDLSKDLIQDMNGFCDHEVGHCRYTTMNTIDKIPPKGRSFNLSLLNALEDVRVERLMIKDYPGCVYNLDDLNTKYLTELYDPKKFNSLNWPIQFMLAVTASVTDDTRIPNPSERIARMLTLVDAEVKKFNLARSTDEVLVITTAITNKIISEIKREKAEKEKAEKEDGESDDGESEKVEDDDAGERAEANDDSSDENEDDNFSEAGCDKKGPEDGEEEDGTSNCGDDESENEEGSGSGSEAESVGDDMGEPSNSKPSSKNKSTKPEGDSEATTEKTDEEIKAGNEMLTGERELETPSVDKYINDKIKSEIEGSRNSLPRSHVPSTTEYDEEHDLTGTGHHGDYLNMKKLAAIHTSVIKRQFEKTLKIVENARWCGERERGQINQRSLTSLITQPNYRTPFKQLLKIDTTNVAIELLVDLSESMSGSKINIAKMSVVAIAEALLELGFEFEVTGFSSVSDSRVAIRSGELGDKGRYNRTSERLHHLVFKKFGRNDLSGITKMRCFEQNVDGESVRWAAKRLGEQKEKRKIMMVLSDGNPSANSEIDILEDDLKNSVRQIEKSGIEIIAIGIQTESVRRFYKNAVVVNSLDDLPKKAMNELTKIILKGK